MAESQESCTSLEIAILDKINLFGYPLNIVNTNFHYRGQVPKYNSLTNSFSQLCRYASPEVDKLSRKEKYQDLYTKKYCNEDANKVIVICSVCLNEFKVEFVKNVYENDGSKRICYNNFFKHALVQHISEFTESDIIAHRNTKIGDRGKKTGTILSTIEESFLKNSSNFIEKNKQANHNLSKLITSDIANLIVYGNFPFQLIENPSLRIAIRSVLDRCDAKLKEFKFQSRRTVTKKVKEIVDGLKILILIFMS